MVGSVGATAVNYTTEGSTRHTMSADQKSAVENVLSKYDASSLSSDDAKEISNSFKEMGIKPSSDLRETIETAGFDADSLRELSGTSGIEGKQPPPPPPPPPPKQDYSKELSTIEEILAEILAGDDEDNESKQLTQSEQVMDYTGRIMNLTDNAKNEVKDLFEKFKPDNETGYTQEESKNIVTNSLKSILSNNDNYNHVSFYG
jgi:hypothetical protein